MRKTDISKYTAKTEKSSLQERGQKESPVKNAFKVVWKIFITVLMVFVSACIIVGISMTVYVIGIANEPTGIDLHARALNLSSHIYCQNPDTGEFEETQSLYGLENRIWVDFKDIPQAMKDAIISIEDKRFYEHSGVDWVRTAGAVLNLATGQDSYGGSTLTQQLIKNITADDEVSLTRKLREIFKALNVEHEYTKDEILEAYLNVVNFGNNCQGVQAAAQLYFDKDISQCSAAECAAIAGITQNPSLWNPLVYPDNNKQRRETVLAAMHDQGKLNDEEYAAAMKESEDMKFVGFSYDDDELDDNENNNVQSWYIDNLYSQLQSDLSKYYNISESAASDKMLTEGLKIYCAVDLNAQAAMEKAAKEIDRSEDPELQIGMTMVDLKGRILATVGNADEKTANLVWSNATDSSLQPGSSIKPLFSYPMAIEDDEINYSSYVKDEKMDSFYADGSEGPNNWYSGTKGNMLVPDAIEWSSNCTAVQLMNTVGVRNAYDKAVTLMGFTHLDPDQDSINVGGLSIGGLNGGVTVEEMAAAYSYIGNGGRYYKPYSYYYVTDSNDKVILDNRDSIPKQAYKPETAAIMNRLLRYNIVNSAHTTAYLARISDWDIVGKTGTTDKDKDAWFCGLSPYASLAIWTGYEMPETISATGRNVAANTFKKVMSSYLDGKEKKDYVLPENVIEKDYCVYTGLLASSYCTDTEKGYYTEDNMPGYCYGGHGGGSSDSDDNDNDDNSSSSSHQNGTKPNTTTTGSDSENPSDAAPTQAATDSPAEKPTGTNSGSNQ